MTDDNLPSVAGRMEMTHEFFQCVCRLELRRLQEDPNCDNGIVHLLCEAVRCSRECCKLTTAGLRVPTELAVEREKVRALREALQQIYSLGVNSQSVACRLASARQIAKLTFDATEPKEAK